MKRDAIVLGLLMALQIQIAAPPVQANPAAGEQSKNVFVLTAGEDRGHWMSPEHLPRNGWLALFDDGKAMRIGRTKVVVLKSEGTGSSEITEVDSKPAGARLLFHGVPGLKVGPVHLPEWVHDSGGPSSGSIVPGQTIEMRLGKISYRLALKTSGPGYMDARLILETKGRRQVLYALKGNGDEPHFSLYLIGDLDGDGKLDLIATMSPKYSWSPMSVLLSSAAAPGELVHEVASYDDYSC
jgi:hypothetical protein